LRVVVLYNPRSGRGRGARAAARFADGLERFGNQAVRIEVGDPGLAGALAGASALAVVGGDGTLHHTLAGLVEGGRGAADIPGIYHVPMGTENLFAREFGMTDDPARLNGLLEAGACRAIDLGECNGRVFVLMCGVGPDAGVLARLNAGSQVGGRRGPISPRSYVRPVLAELMSLNLPILTVRLDGRTIVDRQSGLMVIGNSRQYAWRVDPAVRASMTDGLLDVVFFPARGRGEMLGWALACRMRRHTRSRSLIYQTGRKVEVSTEGGQAAYQLDGEAFTSPDGCFSILVRPGALRVWA
jgi:diacylglycerol kinase (ATP)